jgi:hypothetical protein
MINIHHWFIKIINKTKLTNYILVNKNELKSREFTITKFELE